ncbi:MAG: hypothetical protein LBC48_00965 [Dysgonamonadaceae bacterium]|nr:hypothetical protein [Dysgonamonadaceae bacterium]
MDRAYNSPAEPAVVQQGAIISGERRLSLLQSNPERIKIWVAGCETSGRRNPPYGLWSMTA